MSEQTPPTMRELLDAIPPMGKYPREILAARVEKVLALTPLSTISKSYRSGWAVALIEVRRILDGLEG